MSEEFSKEKAKKFVSEMIEANTSASDILKILIKKGFNQNEAEEIVIPFYHKKLKQTIKKQLTISIILAIAIVALISLYVYEENKNDSFAQMEIEKGNGILNKDGTYMVIGRFQNFDFLMKTAVLLFIGLAFTLFRLLINNKKLKQR